jgi:acyl dehydratase
MSDSEEGEKRLPASEIIGLTGVFQGISSWRAITQEMIDRFADITDDHQFIHVDPERATAETTFGGTIAHGFLVLSMLSAMAYETLPKAANAAMGINYGFDKIRFLAPVRVGSRIRGVFRLATCEMRRKNEMVAQYDVTIEIEDEEKPALVAEWYGMTVLATEARGDGETA